MFLNLISITVLIVFLFVTLKQYYKKQQTYISFKESLDLSGLPVVTFYNNEQKLNFLLDTGSNFSYINASMVPKVQVNMTNQENTYTGVSGETMKSRLCTMIITYKNQNFVSAFNIADLEESFNVVKADTGVQIHGILGSQFFEKYKYVLDYKDFIAYVK